MHELSLLDTQAAENGSSAELDRLMEVLSKPYETQPEADAQGYAESAPRWASVPGVKQLS